MKINVILLQSEDRPLVSVTAREGRLPDLKIRLDPVRLGAYFLPTATFPAAG